jgi:hypothetical protein
MEDPRTPGVCSVRGSIYFLLGDFFHAEADFREGLRRIEKYDCNATGQALAMADLALVLMRTGKRQIARRMLFDALKLAQKGNHKGTIIRIERRVALSQLPWNPISAVRFWWLSNCEAMNCRLFDQVRWFPPFL